MPAPDFANLNALAAKIAAKKDAVLDLAYLKVVAQMATPGPRKITRCPCGAPTCKQFFIDLARSDGRFDPEDANFFEAFDPQTVLALIALAEQGQRALT